jgi:biopolymer transport protein ExbD
MRATSNALHSEINVTPLVDVCLVLLIIFMVVTPVLVNGVPVHLPQAKSADPAGDQILPITLNADGTLYADATVIRREQLSDLLRERHAQHPERPVVVRADKTVNYGEVVSVLDACRGAGFHDVGLATEKR